MDESPLQTEMRHLANTVRDVVESTRSEIEALRESDKQRDLQLRKLIDERDRTNKTRLLATMAIVVPVMISLVGFIMLNQKSQSASFRSHLIYHNEYSRVIGELEGRVQSLKGCRYE